MIDLVRAVEADEGIRGEARNDEILGVIERPGVIARGEVAPFRQSRIHAIGGRGVQEFNEAREPAL